MGKVEFVLVTSCFAIAALMILLNQSNHGAIHHLPKFSHVIHYCCNDNWPSTFGYGDLVFRMNKSGIVDKIYIVGHMNSRIELNADEIHAMEKIYDLKIN